MRVRFFRDLDSLGEWDMPAPPRVGESVILASHYRVYGVSWIQELPNSEVVALVELADIANLAEPLPVEKSA
jgi:hypothetical protein